MEQPVKSTFQEKRVSRHSDVAAVEGRLHRDMTQRRLTGVRLIELLLDPTLAVLSLWFCAALFGIPFDGPEDRNLSLLVFLLSYLVFKEIDVCRSWRYGGVRAQSRDTLMAWFMVLGLLLVLGYATKTGQQYSRQLMLSWGLITPAVLLAGHLIVRRIMFAVGTSAKFTRSVVVVGVNGLARKLVEELRTDRRLHMRFAGYFDDRSYARAQGIAEEELLGPLDALPKFVAQHGIDVIYITLPMAQQKRILDLLDSLRDTTASIYFAPDFFLFDLIQSRVDDVNGIPVVGICETPFYGINGALKRLSDLTLGFFMLVVLSPLLIAIALAVKLSSAGPVIFRQRRFGLDGEEIVVYKFRSMTTLQDGEKIMQVTREDQRVTRLGRILRRYSLDELPQLVNVLQGRMSLVGPRPHAVAHNQLYRGLIKGYMVRHKVRPGLTGWAQVNGLRGETDTLDKMKARIALDLEYLRRWSLWLDLRIIFKTALIVFRDNNAY